MKQVTNIQDLRTTIEENGEMVITVSNDEMVIMDMKEYQHMLEKREIENHLLKSEEDYKMGRVRDAKEVFTEWKEKYGI
jgi:PHD/YefM family antitoxin component YafN of YafNO toxin-antitoxin module